MVSRCKDMKLTILTLLVLMACNDHNPKKCPPMNARKMSLIGVDKCGCLYGVSAVQSNPDSVAVYNGVMFTVDRKPCL